MEWSQSLSIFNLRMSGEEPLQISAQSLELITIDSYSKQEPSISKAKNSLLMANSSHLLA